MQPSGKPATPRPAAPPKTPETGQLSIFDAANIIIGIVIGTTVFKTPPLIFGSAGGPWGGLLAWVVGGVMAFIGALCYAELATSFPRSGGDYVYLTKAFGPWSGFVFGWAQLTIIMTCSIGAMAVVFAEYATKLYDLTQVVQVANLSSVFLYAVLAVTVITLLNLVGVVLGKVAQNVLSMLKIAGVVAIIVAGLGWSTSNPTEWAGTSTGDWSFGALAIILIMYAYGGWNDAAFVAAEVRDPRRNIPKALLFGVGVIMALYLLLNLAYLMGLGFDVASQKGVPMSEQKLIPLLVMNNAFGDFGEKAINIVIMISALGAVNGLIFTGARVYATLGNDHRLFSWLGHWKPGQGAPMLALVVQAIITLSMVGAFATDHGHQMVNQLLGGLSDVSNSILGHAADSPDRVNLTLDQSAGGAFEKLFAVSAPFFWFFFLMTGLSLFVLRDQTTPQTRPFTVPLFPVLPLIFCNMCVFMLYRSFIFLQEPWMRLTPVFVSFVVLVLLGLPLYALSRRLGYHEGAMDE